MAEERIVCAGFGGQGIMLLGQMIAYAAVDNGLETLWVPTYGPETRGGTANCSVFVSSEVIGAPVIHGDATDVLVMNEPSLERFENTLVPGGRIFLNQGLVTRLPVRQDLQVYGLPATALATEIGDPRVANMVMLGAFIQISKLFTEEQLSLLLVKLLGGRKKTMVDINRRAIRLGMDKVQRLR
jgi:2-oxoglutarate ferredoxin oxidoreductase subunit gamma